MRQTNTSLIMRFITLCAVLVYGITFLPACSGGGGGGGGSDSVPSVNELTSKLVAAYGGDGGTDAVLLALDRGYSLQQIVDAGMAGLLSSSGVVTDSGGATVAPDNAPVGNISRSSNDLGATSDVAAIRNWLKTKAAEGGYGNAEGIGTIFLIAMVLDGYDYEQIYEAFLFGYSFARTCQNGRYYVTIVDESGNAVNPNNPTGLNYLEPEHCEENTGGDTSDDTGGADTVETWILGEWNSVGAGNSGSSSNGVLTFHSDGTYSHSYDWAANDGSSGHANLTYSWWLSGSTLLMERGVGTCSGSVTLNANTINVGGCPSGWAWTLTR